MASNSKLIIFIAPNESQMTPSERGQINPARWNNRQRKGPLTPSGRVNRTRRVINLAQYNPELNYAELAKDLCSDAGDKYYGHEFA